MEFTMEAIKAAARAYKRRSDPLLSEAGEMIGQCTDTIERLQKAFDDDQEVLKGLEQERDAALAEVKRLKDDIKSETMKMVEDMYPSSEAR